ncbi:Uu.00g144010.m01.CDS01 [Anthostomella pinea]|uniref:Uu.00g144010.m01.CDS01 n=1 Tax=Anthostomella pinea TaxID=933095 RepID=A0AAI8VQT8_9PEZI|nr:Uu.00g144010.m01.CDS01 [Anthostomella pinea]
MNVTTHYTAEMANVAANTTLATLPATFVTLLSVFLLDTFAVMLAGLVQPVYRRAVSTITHTHGTGGPGNHTYAALDGTTTSLSGQLFLASLAAGDFEFEHVIENSHPASAVLPAVLCIAAAHHKGGEEFLTALAIGYEFATRIGYATTLEAETIRGFHAIGLNGPIATAAAVGRLLGLDADTIASAMGIAASSCGGLQAYIGTEADTRRVHPARAGQLGAEAALQAAAGIRGPTDVLENPKGYFHAFSPHPEWAYLLEGLGTQWTSAAQVLKAAPVHAWAQGYVHAINEYRAAGHAWGPDDVGNVTVYGNAPHVLDPNTWTLDPASFSAAQYSVPFGIAAALTTDLRDPMNMNDGILTNATYAIAKEMRQVSISDDPDALWGWLTLDLKGVPTNISFDTFPGLPGAPGYSGLAEEKFANVVGAFGVRGDEVRGMILGVRNLTDVSVLLDAMVAVGSEAMGKFEGRR